MDNKSATTAEAAPVVIEAKTHLEEVTIEPKDDVEKHTKDTNDEKISDVMQILQGLADRFQKIEQKMDCRLQKMEEKVDLFISSISLNNKVGATFKTFSAKAEAENKYMNESSSDEEPFQKKARENTKFPKEESDKRFGLFRGRGRGQESDEHFDLFSFGRGRGGQETVGHFGRFFDDYCQDSYDSYGRFSRARVSGLHVGGRFRGGRCGGQGFCGAC